MRLMNRLIRLWSAFQRRGISYLGYLLTGYLVPQVAYLIRCEVPRLLVKLGGLAIVMAPLALMTRGLGRRKAIRSPEFLSGGAFQRWLSVGSRQTAAYSRQVDVLTVHSPALSTDTTFMSWATFPVELRTRAAVEAARQASPTDEIVLGQIARDGRVWGVFGALPGLEPVDKADFIPCARNQLDIVLVNDAVLVRKDFRGDRRRFARECSQLARLAGLANVPAVYRIDSARCRLYLNLIPARPLHYHPADEATLQAIERELDRIHAAGIAHLSLTLGDILVDSSTRTPWFIDFEDARTYPSIASLAFLSARDQDRITFNRTYGRNLITETSARALLAAQRPWPYAPIDFGYGVTVGQFWSITTGTGRWEFLNSRAMLPVAGMRVLDLGANNGVMAMMLLRAGAREVIGLELSPSHVERAQLVKRLFEWRDMRPYTLQVYNCNMLEILHTDWGQFDMVTALCSLYYLDDADMGRVVRKAAELAPIMVLQANTRLRGEFAHLRPKASVAYLKQLLEANGFPDVTVVAPPNYSRPLLIGWAKRMSTALGPAILEGTAERAVGF